MVCIPVVLTDKWEESEPEARTPGMSTDPEWELGHEEG